MSISTTSDDFSVQAFLSFTTQPTGGLANTPFSCVVKVVDTHGTACPNYTGNVVLTKATGTGALSGTLTVACVAGVATFSNLNIDTNGTNYSLTANSTDPTTSTVLTAVTSSTFTIGAYTLTISANQGPYDVRSAFISAYGSPIPTSAPVQLTVNSGIIVHSDDGGQAIYWGGTWPGTPTFSLVNNGYILGWQGRGGNGGSSDNGSPPVAEAGFAGSAGGNAMNMVGHDISITNADGFIWGGGGGGGGGGGAAGQDGGAVAGCGGGGGAGRGAGDYQFLAGGNGGDNTAQGLWTEVSASASGATSSSPVQSQTGSAGGAGGVVTGAGTLTGGAGGAGGNYGSAGTAGSAGSGSATSNFNAGAGGAAGAAGKAINLAGGVATFVSGSGSPNVKGAVS